MGGDFSPSRQTFVFNDEKAFIFENVVDVGLHIGDVEELLCDILAKSIGGICGDALLDGLHEAVRHPTFLPKGADSHAIALLETIPSSVLKVGPQEILEGEARFIGFVNDLARGAGIVSPFPQIFGASTHEDPAWYLMTAASPETVENRVFLSLGEGELHEDWLDKLRHIFDPMRGIYAASVKKGRCQISTYHYTQRIHGILQRKDFAETFRRLEVSPQSVASIINSQVLLNGQILKPFGGKLDATSHHAAAALPQYLTVVHGDLHLSNILEGGGQLGFLYVDPRIQWDGLRIDKFGFGDPIYDMATMLHSVAIMGPILHNSTAGTTDRLCSVSTALDGTIDVQLSDVLLKNLYDTERAFTQLIDYLIPSKCLDSGWEARLLIGAAGALFGWLKYADAVRDKSAWWAIFAAASWYLDAAQDIFTGAR